MEQFIDQVINGLTIGSQYALIAAGLSLMFGVVGIVNFAHGELYMVGAYLLYVASATVNLPYALAALAAVVGMAAVGALFYVAIVHRILKRGWQVQLVATLAVSIVLVNFVIVVAGALPKQVESPLTRKLLSVGAYQVSYQRILVLVAAVATFALLAAYLKRTKTGKAMRAVAQNQEAAAVVGISVPRVGMAAVVAASVLTGVASATIAPLQNVTHTMGTLVIIKAFAAVIIGGFGNVAGAVIAAFLLGIADAMAIGYLSSVYAGAIVFAIMIVVLLVRPQGLVGKAVRL